MRYSIDKKIKALTLRQEGLSYPEIAKKLNVHRNTVVYWVRVWAPSKNKEIKSLDGKL